MCLDGYLTELDLITTILAGFLKSGFVLTGDRGCSSVTSGDEVIVCVPKELPSPFDDYAPNWKEWVENMRGKEVILKHWNRSSNSSKRTGYSAGWIVRGGPSTNQNSPWLPTEWLTEVETIIRQGCLFL